MFDAKAIVDSLNVGAFNALFEVVKEEYIKDNLASEDTLIRFLEKCDGEDYVDIFRKMDRKPHSSLNITFYDIVQSYPPQLVYYFYEENKLYYKKDFPLILFVHCIDYDENENTKNIFEMFKRKGFYNLNDKESYLYKELTNGQNVFTVLKIEKRLKTDMSKIFLDIEKNINNEDSMFLYISDWADDESVKDYKINGRNLFQRLADSEKINLINSRAIMLIIEEEINDFASISEDNLNFILQLKDDVLENMINVNENIKNLKNYINIMNEKKKIEESIGSPKNASSVQKRL